MDISEVLIEENKQTNNAQLVAEMLATFLRLVFFSLSILHFTLLTFYSIILLCCMCQINSNQIQHHHTSHTSHILFISSPPPPRQSVQLSHTAKEDNKYIEEQDLLQLSWHSMLSSRWMDGWMDGRMFVKL